VNDYYLHFREEYFNTTNLNNIVFFSFCRSLYRYITTVYIFARRKQLICILDENPLLEDISERRWQQDIKVTE